MFEKEAKEYRKENLCKKCHKHCKEGMCTCSECKIKTFKDGAEFGYNKYDERLNKAKKLLKKWVKLFSPKGGNIPPTPIQVETEQFIGEV